MANRVIAIDPGIRCTGIARFEDSELVSCGTEWCGHPCDVLVVEVPQVYRQAVQIGDPNDLIDVAFHAGQIAGMLPHITLRTVRPREWKGQVPKDIHNQRTLAKLDARELKIFSMLKLAESLKHNVIDAIGIGLWHLGR